MSSDLSKLKSGIYRSKTEKLLHKFEIKMEKLQQKQSGNILPLQSDEIEELYIRFIEDNKLQKLFKSFLENQFLQAKTEMNSFKKK
jgi:hypothetical protein